MSDLVTGSYSVSPCSSHRTDLKVLFHVSQSGLCHFSVLLSAMSVCVCVGGCVHMYDVSVEESVCTHTGGGGESAPEMKLALHTAVLGICFLGNRVVSPCRTVYRLPAL